MIALIDYGSGNLHSVRKALLHEGAQVELVSDPDGLEGKSAVVLPGVGAFGDCVRGLQARGLWNPLRDWLARDRPFFGICIGYQMLFDASDESPGIAGFGFLPGRVRRFAECGLKIPQIGWNALSLVQPGHWLWRGLGDRPFVYFVHSFYPEPADAACVIATAEYAGTFAAACARGRVAAVQFHPEKSQAVGLRIIRNFLAIAEGGS